MNINDLARNDFHKIIHKLSRNSGFCVDYDANKPENAEIMKKTLIASGVPEKILIDKDVFSVVDDIMARAVTLQ